MKRYDLRHLKDDFYGRMLDLIDEGIEVDEVGIFLFEVGDYSAIQKSADIIKKSGHNLMNSLKFNEVDWTIVVKKVDNDTIKIKEDEAKIANALAKELAKQKVIEDAKKEAELKVKKEAQAKAKAKAEEQKLELEAVAKIQEEKAKKEAEEKAKNEAEEKAKNEAEEKAKNEAEEKAKNEAEAEVKEEVQEESEAEPEVEVKEENEEKIKVITPTKPFKRPARGKSRKLKGK